MLLRRLSLELQKKAEYELNELPHRTQEDLDHIKQWLEKQPHLISRSDDQFLAGFLRGCKSSIQGAKSKIDYFYTIKSLLPEFFVQRDPFLPEIQTMLKLGLILPLPETNGPAGQRIILWRWSACNPKEIPILNIMKLFFMFLDILMQEDDNCMVAGIRILIDLHKFSGKYIFQITPAFLKKLILCIENAYPIRIGSIDCIHTTSVIETIFDMAKPFMTEKLKQRIHFYNDNNFKIVDENVPLELLPTDYGGKSTCIAELTDTWKFRVETYSKWFEESERFGSDENLRNGRRRTSADLFGVEGTFRKLTID